MANPKVIKKGPDTFHSYRVSVSGDGHPCGPNGEHETDNHGEIRTCANEFNHAMNTIFVTSVTGVDNTGIAIEPDGSGGLRITSCVTGEEIITIPMEEMVGVYDLPYAWSEWNQAVVNA